MDNPPPQSVGIIMDGNRRWARARGLPTFEGHRLGYEKFKDVLEWMKESGIRTVYIYALSTENLKRAEEEVSYLFELFRTVIKTHLKKAAEEGVRIIFAGLREKLPLDLQTMITDFEGETANNTGYTLVVGAPYGGRAEIVTAANRAIKEGAQVTEESFARLLWTHPAPDPDLIIRTGGEKRLSNFLPWQGTYTELFFSDTLWPDFSREEFDAILKEYGTRERRRGA